uniref:Uncharacterized protein LOC111101494 isoform X1 n=1 Tax=Crassostrea virginica TaxID=6565 RepID=A0A8B8AE63_CRAVI|nr:uncharacterized protein LOC111101494 isoform X1 [Crassostrea virginica]
MKGILTWLWTYFHIIDCCSVQDRGYVNAFLSCQTNDTCEAQCYRGYIFPTGKTKTNYSCNQQGLSGIFPSCKRIPIVVIEYRAIWEFLDVLPSKCDNVSSFLSQSDATIGAISRLCNTMEVDVNISFTFFTLAFMMTTTFTGEYYNYTSTDVLDNCLSMHFAVLQNETLPFIGLIFDKLTCWNKGINHTLRDKLYISDRQRHCPIGTEVRNASFTESNKDNTEYYCTNSEEIISISTVSSWTTGFQNSTNFATTLAVNNNTTANFTAMYIAAPILGIASLIVIIFTVLYYKMRSRAFKRQRIYQTILTINDDQANELTNDSHNYDVMAFRENSSENSRY